MWKNDDVRSYPEVFVMQLMASGMHQQVEKSSTVPGFTEDL